MALVPIEKKVTKQSWNIKDTKDPRSKCKWSQLKRMSASK